MKLPWGAGVLSRAVRRAQGALRRQILVFVAAMASEHDDDVLDHVVPSVHDELEERRAPVSVMDEPGHSESPSEPRIIQHAHVSCLLYQDLDSSTSPVVSNLSQNTKHLGPSSPSPERPGPQMGSNTEPESELPDPFQLDDPDDPVSDEEDRHTPVPFGTSSEVTIAPPVTEVPLHTLPQEPEATPFTPAPAAVAKPQPDLPESDDEEDDIPALYLPGLVVPGLFLPIPNTDPLSTLMTKYVPDPNRRISRDISGEWKTKDFHNLVMSNHWRALAQMARDRIVNAPANDLEHILGLWYLRLNCLARLRLFNQTSAECSNLFAVLNNVESPQARAHLFDEVLPFELEIMHARLKYWAGDHLGYLDALSPLLRKCKVRARAATESATAAMWTERGTRVSLTIASQLVEMRDFGAAARFLEPLCQRGEGSPALRSAIARIYLQGGHLGAASQHLAAVEADPSADDITKDMNRAVESAAYGHWDMAIQALERVLRVDPDDALAANNLAVALLSSGKLEGGIRVMESALRANPIAVTATEPWIFNLSTLYELRSTTTWEKKRDLLIDVAKWSGDGLKTSCLKLPAV
ncbi:hypothetical protein JB92DRAFT_2916098 [Gautieria morchelliformis]|nr:hypothetical protein JB92DRAFT_2916098 [Gautieria morchelliformis]